MKLNLADIKKLRAQYREADHELHVLDVKQQRANEALSKATENGNIDSPAVQRALGEARLVLDACGGRRGHVKKALSTITRELQSRCRQIIHAWNAEIAARVKARENEILDALRPFYRTERDLIADCSHFDKFTGFYELRRAFIELTGESPDVFELAMAISRHVHRRAKVLAITLDAADADETE